MNEVSEISHAYEMKNPSFSDFVEDWLSRLETILNENKHRLSAEVSTLRALIHSSKRGILHLEIIRLVSPTHLTKRQIINETSLHALYQIQHALQTILDRFEENYEKAEQLARKILIMAGSRGILTARVRATVDNSTLNLLWNDVVSNEAISPFAASMLELFGSEDVLIIVKKILNEFINPQKSNVVKR